MSRILVVALVLAGCGRIDFDARVDAPVDAGEVTPSDMFVLGGYVDSLGRDEVWRSPDGAAWTLAGRLPAVRGSLAGVVFRGELLVMGGSEIKDGPTFDNVWASRDGATWTVRGVLPSGASAQGVAVFEDRVWLVGAIVQGSNFTTTVWSSADGASWTLEPPLPVALHSAELVVHDGALWSVGGHEATMQSAEVMRREPSGSWTRVGALPVAGEYHSVLERDGLLWAAGGLGLQDRVVTTLDGKTWTDHGLMPAPRQYLTLLERPDGVWAVGGLPGQTWRSDDGVTWEARAALPELVYLTAVVLFAPPAS